jgi:WD40 repeat protein
MPTATRYSKSLMHRDQLFSTTFTPVTDFLITSSVDGVVKFWKKISGGIEFVKEFKAHNGEIRSTSVSADGRSYASAGSDNTVKIFDVITFGESIFRTWQINSANGSRSPCYDSIGEHTILHLLGTRAWSFNSNISSVF